METFIFRFLLKKKTGSDWDTSKNDSLPISHLTKLAIKILNICLYVGEINFFEVYTFNTFISMNVNETMYV